jgi:hypothetical protein
MTSGSGLHTLACQVGAMTLMSCKGHRSSLHTLEIVLSMLVLPLTETRMTWTIS